MLVQLGPVASSSVTMWVAYARTVLGQTMAHPDRSPALDEGLLEQFELLLDEWDASARASSELVWTADLDAPSVERFARSFFDLVSGLAADAEDRGYPISPPEGDEFYWALVDAMLGALTEAGGRHAEVAEQLRGQWPGRKDADET
jgi:hypothetical protein